MSESERNKCGERFFASGRRARQSVVRLLRASSRSSAFFMMMIADDDDASFSRYLYFNDKCAALLPLWSYRLKVNERKEERGNKISRREAHKTTMNLQAIVLAYMLWAVRNVGAVFSSRHSSKSPLIIVPQSSIPVSTSRQSPRNPDAKLLDVALSFRGGASTNLVAKFTTYVAASKTSCWAVLFLAILLEAGATTMIKIARDENSSVKLCFAYSAYFLR
jgi:hypothetical protein